MTERIVEVINSLGIHARPALMIVKTAIKYKSSVQLIKDGASADAKSIMSIMMLAAVCNSKVIVHATGEDEIDAVQAIATLIEQKFSEE